MKNSEERISIKRNIAKSKDTLKILYIFRAGFACLALCWLLVTYVVSPATVKGDSMAPTLVSGDVILNNMISMSFSDIKRFDIVVATSPEDGETLVKRVIGLPNETIQYRDDMLYVDGVPIYESFLDESYRDAIRQNTEFFTKDFGPIKLGENEYFLCGDNRIVSKDSRHIGAISKAAIIGKYVITVYPQNTKGVE